MNIFHKFCIAYFCVLSFNVEESLLFWSSMLSTFQSCHSSFPIFTSTIFCCVMFLNIYFYRYFWFADSGQVRLKECYHVPWWSSHRCPEWSPLLAMFAINVSKIMSLDNLKIVKISYLALLFKITVFNLLPVLWVFVLLFFQNWPPVNCRVIIE